MWLNALSTYSRECELRNKNKKLDLQICITKKQTKKIAQTVYKECPHHPPGSQRTHEPLLQLPAADLISLVFFIVWVHGKPDRRSWNT